MQPPRFSVQISKVDVYWRDFLESLTERGLRDVQCDTSDDHVGLKAARRAVFGGVKWQCCQFHNAQNAIHQAPSLAVCKRIGNELRAMWNALDLPAAQRAKEELMAKFREAAPKLADWLGEDVGEGLTVIILPDRHRRRLRIANAVERSLN